MPDTKNENFHPNQQKEILNEDLMIRMHQDNLQKRRAVGDEQDGKLIWFSVFEINIKFI